MDPNAQPYWPLASMLLCAALLVPVVTSGIGTARTRAFAVLLLALCADAAMVLAFLAMDQQGISAVELPRQWLPLAIPPLALWFSDAAFPGHRGRRAPALTAVTLLGLAAVALLGPSNLSGVTAQPGGPWRLAAIGLQASAWAGAFAGLALAFRRHRDPMERNRMKYVAIALAGLGGASVLYWVPNPDWQVFRPAASALSAAILGFGLLQRDPPNFDTAFRRGVGRLLVGAPTAFIYVGALVMLVRALDLTLASIAGLVLAVLLALGAAFIAAYMRAVTSRFLERPILARQRDREARLAALAHDAGTVRSVKELATALTASCQQALDAEFVALLASTEPGQPLRVVGVSRHSGLDVRDQDVAGLPDDLAIAADNQLLTYLQGLGRVATPFALAACVEEGKASPRAIAEFAPLRASILAPMVSQGVTIGLLAAGHRHNDAAYRLTDLELLASVAARGALSLQNARLIEQLRAAAQTDFTTGLPNHRELQEVFTRLIEEAAQRSEPLSCAIVDIDGFKQFNDTFGRQSGDEALALIARTIVDTVGAEGIVGRYGGDEFLVLLPRTTRARAGEQLRRVGAAVRGLTLTPTFAPPGAPLSTSARVSWGLAAFPEDGATRRALTSAADSQLMQRKFEGRRPVSMSAGRPVTGHLLESDPEKLRVARGLIELIAEKDPQTAERSQQIAALALLVADDLRLSEQERYELWLGSLLHDVGKVGTPEAILRKAEGLTPEEWAEMRKHAALGERLIRGLLNTETVSEIAGCHHERYDGLGYPRGLAGEDIPRMARIVSVADAFSAMVHERPHRRKLPWPEAMVELRRHAGTQFDPAIIEVFLRAVGRSDFRVAA